MAKGGGNGGNMVDSRGIGRPPSFSGEEGHWFEWHLKLSAYLNAASEDAASWVKEWSDNATVITDEDLDCTTGRTLLRK